MPQDITTQIVGGLGNATQPDPTFWFDDLLKEHIEQLDISEGNIGQDYNTFVKYLEEDKTIFKERSAKVYAEALSGQFEESLKAGGEKSSIRLKGQKRIGEAREEAESDFERKQARAKEGAETRQTRELETSQRRFAVQKLAYDAAYQDTI